MEQFEFCGMTIVVRHYLPLIAATFEHEAEGGEIEFQAYDSDGNEILEELPDDEIFAAFESHLVQKHG